MAGKEALRKQVTSTIKLIVGAGQASPKPPVGAALGQAGLNSMLFCKDFNARTQKFKPETPISVKLLAYKDKSFDFTIKTPPVSWYLKKAAGVDTASGRAGHVHVASVTIKHVFEIAKVKKDDPGCGHLDIKSICNSVIGSANSMGIKVVKDLD